MQPTPPANPLKPSIGLMLALLLSACAHSAPPPASTQATPPPEATPMADATPFEPAPLPPAPPAPSLKSLWDFSDPAGTEARFLTLAQVATSSEKAIYLTQAARAQGLQGKYDEGHATLDTLLPQLDALPPEVSIRFNLERGRLFNSAGKAGLALPYFREAAELGQGTGHLPLAIDAIHMEAIAVGGEASIPLNLEGLSLAKASDDPGAQSWQGPLLNNLGWAYFEAGRFDEALNTFQEGLAFRESQGKEVPILLAIYSVARTQRALGQCPEALPQLERAQVRWLALGQADGYTQGEIALCKGDLGHDDAPEAAQKALTLLEADPWVVENEAKLLEELRSLKG